MSVVFCDLVGSTRLAACLDPEDWREVLKAYQRSSSGVVEKLEGHVAQYLGDGILVYFGYPRAHEDDAERAVRAGLGMVAAIEELNPSLELRYRLRIRIRVGIHTGPVVVGDVGAGARRETLALGDAPNVAARLQGLAEPGTVVMSSATLALVEGVFVTRDLGAQALKGVAAPVRVHRVERPKEMRSRLRAQAAALTPSVGRDAELELLRRRWEAARGGRGQTVLIEGEAGFGKSRLSLILRQRLAGEVHTWLEARCSAYARDSPLFPVLDLYGRVLGFTPDDSPEEKLRKLEEWAVASGRDLPEVVPVLAAFNSLPLPDRYPPLELGPAGLRRKTLEVLADGVLTRSRQRPVVTLVEDLHWIDPSTLELLSLLIERISGERVLLIATYRPDFTPPWREGDGISRLRLERLAEGAVKELIRGCAGRELPPRVVEEIVRRTDGIPLYVEEVTKALIHSADLSAAGGESRLAIPETLRDSLMARLDQLGPAKELAQLAACVGREFSHELLAALYQVDEELVLRRVRRAIQAGILFQRGAAPRATYGFNHALIQEAAYRSLLRARRAQTHRRIAEALERGFADVVERQPEALAHHFQAAGELERALDYWHLAGQRALERSACIEAERHLGRALDAVRGLPDGAPRIGRELQLRNLRGMARMGIEGWGSPRVEEDMVRAYRLSRKLGDVAGQIPVLHGLFMFYLLRADRERIPRLTRELARCAEETGEPVHRMAARIAQANAAGLAGRHDEVIATCETLLEDRDPELDGRFVSAFGTHPISWTQNLRGFSYWYLGFPDRALECSREAIRLTDGSPLLLLPLAASLYPQAAFRLWRGELEECRAVARRLVDLATEHGFKFYCGTGLTIQGAEQAARGELDDGLAKMDEGLDILRESGTRYGLPLWLFARTELLLGAGRLDEAEAALEEAATFAAATLSDYCAAEKPRLEGELLRRRDGPTPAAESCCRRALELAREQSSRALELRAASSLARLYRQRGEIGAARGALEPVRDGFTEGFTTRDLKSADGLLAELT